jgi:hypothetical protein
LAAEQFLTSKAFGVPALEQVLAGHGVPLSVQTPPEQLPLPFILPAEASFVKTGAGIDKLSTAKTAAAKVGIIHFIILPPLKMNFRRIHLAIVP